MYIHNAPSLPFIRNVRSLDSQFSHLLGFFFGLRGSKHLQKHLVWLEDFGRLLGCPRELIKDQYMGDFGWFFGTSPTDHIRMSLEGTWKSVFLRFFRGKSRKLAHETRTYLLLNDLDIIADPTMSQSKGSSYHLFSACLWVRTGLTGYHGHPSGSLGHPVSVRNKVISCSSWWLQPSLKKYIIVKMGSSSPK